MRSELSKQYTYVTYMGSVLIKKLKDVTSLGGRKSYEKCGLWKMVVRDTETEDISSCKS